MTIPLNFGVMQITFPIRFAVLAATLLLAACGELWNDPYPVAERGRNILYTAFTERPKHLDPAQSYTEDEYGFINQIYEPPLQYHFLKRPFELIPGAAEQVPVPRLYDADGKVLPADAPAERIVRSVYEIRIKPGIRFQPHPAFALDDGGRSAYLPMPADVLDKVRGIPDFPHSGSRELTADDYIYALKRLAHPRLHSPIYGLMAGYIVGLADLAKVLDGEAKTNAGWIDLDRFPLAGVERVDRYTYRIAIKGKYPQFAYWLAMPFFAPVPREVDAFYAQPGMREKNLTLDWWPVGTGPYYLAENNPNARMVLRRNPNFHGEAYPAEGEPGDREAGMLADAGKPMPFIDEAVFTREKETIPYWNKFLQGYYDASGISSDSFDQAVRVNVGGDALLTDEMQKKDIKLLTSVRASIFYLGFNMLDPVLGKLDDRGRKLRQAISIAIDQEEFIAIFMNGRGLPGMGPIPPGIFGQLDGREGINPAIYDWVDGKPKRKDVEVARRLIAEAGYPNGREAKTGEPLVLNLDTTSGGMGDKSRLDWLTRQFKKIDVQLVVRTTDYNRFQEKLRKGAVQMFYLGWNADYPDPENFFFLLNGEESKVQKGGENAANYQNPEFDRLFAQMKNMDNSPARLDIIRRMTKIVQEDAPWIFGFYPKSFTLTHGWVGNRKPNDIANNTLKYQRIDPALRAVKRAEWNRPVLWPLVAMLLVIISIVLPAALGYRRRERSRGLAQA